MVGGQTIRKATMKRFSGYEVGIHEQQVSGDDLDWLSTYYYFEDMQEAVTFFHSKRDLCENSGTIVKLKECTIWEEFGSIVCTEAGDQVQEMCFYDGSVQVFIGEW